MDIILASTSRYRRALLERLHLDFRCIAPDVNEQPAPQESPDGLALRLARAKAEVVARRHPDALVIGSDQVASIDGCVLGKPGNFDNAREQLLQSSGRVVHFYTGIALASVAQGLEQFHVERFSVRFRVLSEAQINNYLNREEPYDCAGSFKVEGLGIALFEQLLGDDPTSLEGLPLIRLNQMLLDVGVDVLGT